jgi:hypothetical protein
MSVAGMIDEAVELYGLDPSEFVAARTALVRELKAAKRKDEAAAVAKLTRPRMGEYTLNRVARDQPDVVKAFAAAVVAATSAQSSAIGSGDGAALRATSADLRTATAALVDAAGRQLRRDDRDGPAQRDEVLSAVRSLTNQQGAATLVAGVVGSGVEPPEADLFAGAPEPREVPKREKAAKRAPAAKPAPKPAAKAMAKAATKPAGPTKAELAAQRRHQVQLERATTALNRAEREVNNAKRALAAATTRLADAEAARDQAQTELDALPPSP